MTEYSAADMQVAVSRIAAANMSQAPYPLTTEQWAALRSAPAKVERLEAAVAEADHMLELAIKGRLMTSVSLHPVEIALAGLRSTGDSDDS